MKLSIIFFSIISVLLFKWIYLFSDDFLKYYYVILIIFLIFSPLKYSLINYFCLIIFLPQSIWYSSYNQKFLTIYEIEILGAKFIELLTYSLLAKVIIIYHLNKNNNTNILNNKISRESKIFIFTWLLIIFLGVIRGIANGNSTYDIFLFAEFRTLLLGLCFFYILNKILLNKPKFILELINYFHVFLIVKLIFILPEYIFGSNYILLWPITAEGYIQNSPSFFGADSDVYIVLFGLFLLVINMVEQKQYNNKKIILILVYCASIFLSLRRGPLIGMIILTIYTLYKLNIINKILITYTFGILFSLLIFNIKDNSNIIMLFYQRIVGQDDKVQKSNLGHILDIQDSIKDISESPILGKGVGFRFDLTRMQIQNKDKSITAHSGLLQSWVKFGLVGVIFYLYTFLKFIRYKRYNLNNSFYLNASILFLLSIFIWELFIPPFFQGFRRTVIVMFAITLIVIANSNTIINNDILKANAK